MSCIKILSKITTMGNSTVNRTSEFNSSQQIPPSLPSHLPHFYAPPPPLTSCPVSSFSALSFFPPTPDSISPSSSSSETELQVLLPSLLLLAQMELCQPPAHHVSSFLASRLHSFLPQTCKLFMSASFESSELRDVMSPLSD